MLFSNILSTYKHEDEKFQQNFDMSPCQRMVTAIKLLDQKLRLVYKRTTKQQPGELFTQKTREADTLPKFQSVVESLVSIKDTIDGNLSRLENKFSNSGTVNVRSEKNGTPAEKEVCMLHVMLA